ncbi:hypothetical protein ACVCNR_22180 (plasmid) [Aquamicrobium terrae]
MLSIAIGDLALRPQGHRSGPEDADGYKADCRKQDVDASAGWDCDPALILELGKTILDTVMPAADYLSRL